MICYIGYYIYYLSGFILLERIVCLFGFKIMMLIGCCMNGCYFVFFVVLGVSYFIFKDKIFC